MMDYRSLTIRDASPQDVDHVVRRMRARDREEIYGVRFSKSDDDLIAEMVHCPSVFFYAVARAHVWRPVALIQLVLITPCCAAVNLLATDEWALVARDATRFIRTVMRKQCEATGLQRLEVRALASWAENLRWLKSLGAKLECVVEGFGPAAYAQLAWTREELPCA